MSNESLNTRARAWDIINKEMHYNFQSIWIKSGQEEEIPSGVIFSSDLFTPSFEKWPPEEEKERKFAVMEWVHAVDEMSIPIYECDLVNVKEENKEWVGVVFWNRRGCALCWNISETKDGKLCDYCYFDKPAKFTVIGNIYENTGLVNHLIEMGALILSK